MKQTKTIECEICDICTKNEAPRRSKCLGCGKSVCYECQEEGRVKKYQHGVYVSGYGDGIYCLECDEALTAAGNPLLVAYQVIARLHDESREWGTDFKARTAKAEANLERLQKDDPAFDCT